MTLFVPRLVPPFFCNESHLLLFGEKKMKIYVVDSSNQLIQNLTPMIKYAKRVNDCCTPITLLYVPLQFLEPKNIEKRTLASHAKSPYPFITMVEYGTGNFNISIHCLD